MWGIIRELGKQAPNAHSQPNASNIDCQRSCGYEPTCACPASSPDAALPATLMLRHGDGVHRLPMPLVERFSSSSTSLSRHSNLKCGSFGLLSDVVQYFRPALPDDCTPSVGLVGRLQLILRLCWAPLRASEMAVRVLDGQLFSASFLDCVLLLTDGCLCSLLIVCPRS